MAIQSIPGPNRHVYEYLTYYLGLTHSPQYAVVINGLWGIGKTYLIKRFLQIHYGEERRYVYISLYGLTKIDDIDSALFQAAYPVAAKLTAVGARLGSIALKYLGTDADIKINARDILARLNQELYVFDDLERCGMPIDQVLGYINEFVEHQGAKVVIIANEREIEDNAAYRKRREKLIGKTLEVQSAFDEAFAYFTSLIDFPDAKSLFKKKAADIAEIYEQSGLRNLRILQQTMWDFERFFRSLSDTHRNNDEATSTLLRLLFVLSFELKAARLHETDLSERTNRLIAAMERQEGKNSSAMSKAGQLYPDIDLSDPILPNEILVDVLVKGIVDGAMIRTALDQSRHFISVADEPWRTAWHWFDRNEQDVVNALEKMEIAFAKREFTVVGEILHVFGIRLLMSKIGVLQKSLAQIVSEGKEYVDALYDQRRLSVPVPTGSLDIGLAFAGYGGLGIHETQSSEYQDLAAYLQSRRKQALEDSYPDKGRALLTEMRSDTHLYFRRLCLTNSAENLYYDTPILAAIEPKEFVRTCLSISPAGQRTVFMVFQDRYQNGRLEGSLAPEKAWLIQVKKLLLEAAAQMSPVGRYRLTCMIDASLAMVVSTPE